MWYFAYIRPFLFFYILPRLQCFYYICMFSYIYTIETLIIGVFLYIEETLFFLLYFAPEMCILYIQCFPYSKNNTFLSIHFFLFCPDCSVCFSCIYIEIRHFPQKNMCFTIYIEERRFFLCIFPIYIGQLFGLPRLLVFLLYIQKPFLFFGFPQPIVFLYIGENNAFIYSTVQIMVFFLYMRILHFFSYISCYNIPYRCFSIYISIKDTPFLFYFCPDSLYSFYSDCFLIYRQ